MKTCIKCDKSLPEADFPKNKSAAGTIYLHTACRSCRREQCRAWSKTEGGRKVKRRGILRRDYGITVEEYSAMHDSQKGLCAICFQPETKMLHGAVMRLSVDHDHDTGRVRSLLCQACNIALGSFADDPKRIRQAADYIEYHRQVVFESPPASE